MTGSGTLQVRNKHTHTLRFNGHFARWTWVSRVFIEVKDDGSGGDNWSYESCKAPVKSSPPTNQHPAFLQAGCPSCRPTNSVRNKQKKTNLFNSPLSRWTWFEPVPGIYKSVFRSQHHHRYYSITVAQIPSNHFPPFTMIHSTAWF